MRRHGRLHRYRVTSALLAALMVFAFVPVQAGGIFVTPDISGTITAEGGAPIPGATALLYKWVADGESGSWVKIASASADGAGDYGFSSLETRLYRVGFQAPGYYVGYYDGAETLAGATTISYTAGTEVQGVDGVLYSMDPSISGTVIEDSIDGPVPLKEIKAKVFKRNGSGGYDYYTYAWTDANGDYSVNGLPAGTYRIWFYDYGDKYINEYWNDVPELSLATDLVFDGTNEVTDVDAALLAKPAPVSGTVRDEDTGDPIEGIKVVLEPKSATGSISRDALACSGQAYTDAYGRYRIYGLSSGSYSIEFLDEDYSDGAYRGEFYDDKPSFAAADPVTYAGVPLTSIDASLTPLAAAITGQVTSESAISPEPLEGIKAKVFKSNGSGGWDYLTYAWTDANGVFTVYGLDAGTYRIWFYDYDGNYVKEYWDDSQSLYDADDIVYDGVNLVTGIDAALAAAPRVAGKTRYSTATEIAKKGFPGWDGIDTVIVSSGDDRAAADPLAASGLCWLYDAPLLLVSAKSTPDEVLVAVRDIVGVNGPIKIRVVGGPVSVPNARVTAIKTYVEGYFGKTGLVSWTRVTDTGGRYYLSRKIAEEMKSNAAAHGKTLPASALIANGEDYTKFFDALAMSPVAAQNGTPVLLVATKSVPDDTEKALAMLKAAGVTETVIGGGPNTVSDGVATRLGKLGFDVERWYGRSRYDTAVDIARKAQARGWLDDAVAGVAAKLPDALAGGSMIGLHKGVLLLTKSGELPPSTEWWLDSYGDGVSDCYLFGGPNSVTDTVKNDIQSKLQ